MLKLRRIFPRFSLLLRSKSLCHAHKFTLRKYISLHKNLLESFSFSKSVAVTQNSDLTRMSECKEKWNWKNISFSFDSTGKKHVLPVSLLMQITSLVQKKKDEIASQILKEGLRSTSRSLTEVESDNVVDEHLENEEQHVEPKMEAELAEGNSVYKKKKKKNASSESRGEDDVKIKKKRPNYFVAVQITNPEIHGVAKKIQAGIQEATKINLRHAIIGAEKFHITLMVMNLPNKEEVEKAVESLEKCVPLILERTCGQSVTLDFEGLSTFSGGRVLFASLKPSEGLDHLHYMADEVSAQMKNNGIVSTDKPGKKFNPHLTLIKFDGGRRQRIKKVEASHYKQYVNEVFGAQTICSMQLCHMDKKREDGYYFVHHEVFLNR